MDYKKFAKKYLLKSVKNKFPAQELWIDDELNFCAFEKAQNQLIITEGIYNINNRTIDFVTKSYNHPDIEYTLDNYLNEKLVQGYECFASQLFV
jgi:hypothetical protein